LWVTWAGGARCLVMVGDDLDVVAAADLALLDEWAVGLEAVGELIGPRFFRREPRERALTYLKGLLSQVATRNGWTVAEAAGEKTPTGMQRLLNDAVWDEAGVREDLRGYVVAHLGADDGVLVFDETGDIKQGNDTVGVARQYTGVTGQVENCQVSVHAGYVSSRGQALIDTELYLPEAFAHDSQRCAKTGVPADRAGVVITKGDLATVMFGRAVTAGMPFGYVAGDEVYGRSATLRAAIEDTGEHGYVLEVGCDFRISRAPGDKLRADVLPVEVPSWGWEHRSQGHGSKGLRYHAWAWIALASSDCPPGWRRSLLIRRAPDDTTAADHSARTGKADKNTKNGKGGKGGKGGAEGTGGDRTAGASEQYAYFLCYHRVGTTLSELIQVAGRRWGIEESFAVTKSETGLDEHQVRRWTAWYRHAILSMLAAAFLAAMRARLPANPTAWQAA
jgi:SRSO17 transposase